MNLVKVIGMFSMIKMRAYRLRVLVVVFYLFLFVFLLVICAVAQEQNSQLLIFCSETQYFGSNISIPAPKY